MKLSLLMGFHSHQPLGNFDYVFEEAYRKSYLPFIEVIEKHPAFKVTLHYTGPLLLWLKENRPEFLEKLRELGRRGQVEFVISGFYEPVLLLIPDEDRLMQVRKAAKFVREELSSEPRGLWLTERVWESELIGSLKRAGVDYVVVDDFHFRCAGLMKNELYGYYLTESGGETLALFPIDEKLRYLIPFRQVDEVMAYLWEIRERGGRTAIIFDDGEKFGLWPGTHRWVYQEGWLDDFIGKIEQADWIETATFGEYLSKNPPIGRVYLPSNSYFEMGEWSLPPARARDFGNLVKRLRETGLDGLADGFVRGGIFQNFLVKYSEANRMHKKMMLLRRDAEKLRGRKKKEAIEYIHRAQCNDAYWHGIFGGLYLPHLRKEVYRNLLVAERFLGNRKSIRVEDIDADGREEIYARSGDLVIQVKPSQGGAVTEISLLSHSVNLLNTLTRRFEHYHEGIAEKSGEGGVFSIHELSRQVDEHTREALVYDDHERLSFVDHLYFGPPRAEELMKGKSRDIIDFHRLPYSFHLFDGGVELEVKAVFGSGEVALRKRFFLSEELKALYEIKLPSALERGAFFGVELNFALPTPGVEETYLESNGVRMRTDQVLDMDDAGLLRVKDKIGFRVDVEVTPKALMRIYPVYTVSQSESGFDLTYQETCIVFLWEIEPGSTEELAVNFSFAREGG